MEGAMATGGNVATAATTGGGGRGRLRCWWWWQKGPPPLLVVVAEGAAAGEGRGQHACRKHVIPRCTAAMGGVGAVEEEAIGGEVGGVVEKEAKGDGGVVEAGRGTH